MCFRQSEDRAKKRTSPTPDIPELRENLMLLLSKWTNFLQPDAVKELKKIVQHVEKGCLHNIQVGCGTSQNENTHKHLNSFMNKRNIISPDTALCLLNIFFYERNKRIAASKKVEVKSVVMSDPQLDSNINYIGIGLSDDIPNKEYTETKSGKESRSTSGDHWKVCQSFITSLENLKIESDSFSFCNILFDYKGTADSLKEMSTYGNDRILQSKLNTFCKTIVDSHPNITDAFCETIMHQIQLQQSVCTWMHLDTVNNKILSNYLTKDLHTSINTSLAKKFKKWINSEIELKDTELSFTLQTLSDITNHIVILVDPGTTNSFHSFCPEQNTFSQFPVVLGKVGHAYYSVKALSSTVQCKCGEKNDDKKEKCKSLRCNCFSSGRQCFNCKCKCKYV